MHTRDPQHASETNLSQVNLNLLVALDALLRERHVARAAQRVGVTPSAMSQSLRQLRALYDDPLLVRTPTGMCPTPRGASIAREVSAGLNTLRGTLQSPSFDPGTSTRTFTLGVSDAVALSIVPDLMATAAQHAPHVTWQVQPLEPRSHARAEQLERGTVDLVFGSELDRLPGLQQAFLYGDGLVGLARNDHPHVVPRPTQKQYARLSHVVFSPPTTGSDTDFFCDRLIQAGSISKVALRTTYFLLAAMVVAESDHVLLVKRHMAPTLLKRFPLRTFIPPFETGDREYHVMWHGRFDRDPAHMWLRTQVLAISADRRAQAKETQMAG